MTWSWERHGVVEVGVVSKYSDRSQNSMHLLYIQYFLHVFALEYLATKVSNCS